MVISPAETGHRIQRLRIANGLNQAQLAAATMIPTGGVSMVEHGRQGLDEATLERVADALGCTAKYLTQSQGQPSSTRPWLRAYADLSLIHI